MDLKKKIKKILKEEVDKDICNILVDSYEEGIKVLEKYLGTMEENPGDWKKIEGPLQKWKYYTEEIRKELYDNGMTGDSESDESYTWWHAIQNTFCKY